MIIAQIAALYLFDLACENLYTESYQEDSVMSHNIRLSESAAKQINTIMAKDGAHDYLRVAVDGGGCSGFQYRFEFAKTPEADDIVIEREGAKVVIDEVSVGFLENSEIDYVRGLIGAAFKIHNPQAVASCGCGTSFSI